MVRGIRPRATVLNPAVQPHAQYLYDPITRRAVRYVETVVPTVAIGTNQWIGGDRWYLPIGATDGTSLPWGTTSGGARTFQNWDATEKQMYAAFAFSGTNAMFSGNGLRMAYPTGQFGESTTYTPKNAAVTSCVIQYKAKIGAAFTGDSVGFGAAKATTMASGQHYIQVCSNGSTKFRLTTGDGSTKSTTDGTLTFDTAWHEFKIVWTAGSVKLYIDGTLDITHTTNLPTEPLQPLVLTGSSVTIDWVDVYVGWQ